MEAALQSRQEHGLEVRWTHLPDRLVRTLVAGAPGGASPEMVVVPGLGALAYLLPAVRACAAWTRVHVLDVPGFGSRATAGLPADLTSTSATVASWLASAGLGPVTLFGHSTGAQVALRAALAAPEQVDRLVLAGATFAPRGRRVPHLLRDVAGTVRHEDPAELAAVLPYYLRGARRLPVLLRTALADRPEDRVGDVAAPVLVLRGARDGLCPPDWAQFLADRARDGHCVTLPGAHNMVWTCPAAVSSALRP